MSNRTPDSSSVEPALLAKTYTSFGFDIDIVADGTALFGKQIGPCRRIRVTGAGDVACYFAAAPTTKALITYPANAEDDVQLVKIGASGDGTTSAKITVYW